jgi:hypothetical protein
MADDIYIKVLEWGRDNPGFSSDQLEAQFPSEVRWLWREIGHNNLFISDGVQQPKKYYLTFEDRFRLLELEELREARKSSTRAHWFAGISLLVAAASLAFQTLSQIITAT